MSTETRHVEALRGAQHTVRGPDAAFEMLFFWPADFFVIVNNMRPPYMSI